MSLRERAHAIDVAERFLDEMLRGGTTTAQVFCTSHPDSVDSIFSAAQQRRLRLLAGKVLMDRHAPEALTDSATGASAIANGSLPTGTARIVWRIR